jgi:hypothetical protein
VTILIRPNIEKSPLIKCDIVTNHDQTKHRVTLKNHGWAIRFPLEQRPQVLAKNQVWIAARRLG